MNLRIATLTVLTTLCVGSIALAAKKGGGGGDTGTAESASYTLVKLVPPGADVDESWGRDLDSNGNVVGYFVDNQNRRNGFFYDATKKTYTVFSPGVALHGLNESGAIVGTDANQGIGLYWRSRTDANPIELDPLGGDTDSRAYKVNDSGLVIGSSSGDGTYSPVVWQVRSDGTASAPIALPYAANDVRGDVANMNEADDFGVTQIVGYSGADDLYETAIRWEVALDHHDDPLIVSGPTDLGSPFGYGTAAFDINEFGDVVGISGGQASVKMPGGFLDALPTLRKATSGMAEGINDSGQMVGHQSYLFKGNTVQLAVLWPTATTVVDLSNEVRLERSEALLAAFAINQSGSILAAGYFPSISEGDVTCLLVPVP